MSSYVRSQEFKMEFDGDSISCTLRPMLLEDALALRSAVMVNQETFAKLGMQVLPKYVDDFTGLKDAAGAAISLEDVTSIAYFGPVAMTMLTALVEGGRVKNPTPSGDASTIASPAEA